MDAQQVVVFELLETFKAAYLSKDLKTCQNVLGQLKEMVDQKESLHGNGTGDEGQKLPLGMKSGDPSPREEEHEQLDNLLELPLLLDTKSVDPNPREEEHEQLDASFKLPFDMNSADLKLLEEENAEFEQDAEHDDYTKMPYDFEWINKTNCVEAWKDPASIDENHGKEDVKEDEEEEDEEEDDAKEDDDSGKDEDYVVEDEEEDDDDDSGEDDDEEMQQPVRRSSRINKVNASK